MTKLPDEINSLMNALLNGDSISDLMVADARKRGLTVIRPGQEPWASPIDWLPDSIFGFNPMRNEVEIILVTARRPRRGALKRLVEALEANGLRPAVCSPLPLMQAILERWKWVNHTEGSGIHRRDIWRPR